MVDVLNYSFNTVIESPAHFLTLLKGFAVDNGWSVIEHQESVDWVNLGSGVYGWGSGTDNYLEINSSGYGYQPLRYRIWSEYDDPQNTWLYIVGARPNDPEYSTSSTKTPGHQIDHSWWCPESSLIAWGVDGYGCRHSIPSGRMPSVWFWGDEKTIIVILQVSAVLYQSFAIGSPRLLAEYQDTVELQGLWIGKYSYNDDGVASSAHWDDFEDRYYRWFWCFAKWPITSGTNEYSTCYHRMIWWDGAERGVGSEIFQQLDYGTSLHILRNDNGAYGSFQYDVNARFPGMKKIVCYNDWTDKRVGVSPVVFVRNFTGAYPSPPFYCIGTLPFIYIPWTGLVAGQTIKFGLDEYKVFPLNCFLDDYGVALRFA